jgi:TRAP-type C4-dicarboxylate transport system permease small subunit
LTENDNKASSWVNVYSKVLGKIEFGLAVVSGIILVILMLLTSANVIGRYSMNQPVIGAIEVSVIIFIMMIMLVQPWVQSGKAHLGLEFVLERLSPRKADIARLVALILVFFVVFLLAWQSANFAMRNWHYASHGVHDYRYWPAFLCVSIAFTLICFRLPLQVYEQIMELKKPRNKAEVQ